MTRNELIAVMDNAMTATKEHIAEYGTEYDGVKGEIEAMLMFTGIFENLLSKKIRENWGYENWDFIT